MARTVGEHWEGDTKVTWKDDGDTLGIHYQQDITPVLDKVADINAEGGTPTLDGVGRLLYEFPVTLIMEHAVERGLDWQKLAYLPGYDDEWRLMGQKWSKLTIDQRRTYFG